jgi:hypothetical protein
MKYADVICEKQIELIITVRAHAEQLREYKSRDEAERVADYLRSEHVFDIRYSFFDYAVAATRFALSVSLFCARAYARRIPDGVRLKVHYRTGRSA